MLEERVGASTSADCQYVWGIRYIDDLGLRDRDSDANSGTGSLGKSGSGLDERLYALQDPNYNVVALAESDGDVVTRYRYTAYGAPTSLNPDFTTPYTGPDYAWPYLYTARGQDPETGLMQYRNRYYHTGLGRFINRDPMGYEGSQYSLYEYASTNPVVFTDWNGLGNPWIPPGIMPYPPGILIYDFRCRFRRDPDQCCADANAARKDWEGSVQIAAGAVVCCDGRLVACTFHKSDGSIPGDAHEKGTQVHEDEHVRLGHNEAV